MLALFIWALALYGFMAVLLKMVRYVYSRYSPDRQLTLVLIVCNGEAYIEGTLRILGYRALITRKELRIIVADTGSTDATRKIVRRMQQRDGRIQLLEVDPESALETLTLERLRVESDSPLALFDLRGWENPKQIIPSLARVVG